AYGSCADFGEGDPLLRQLCEKAGFPIGNKTGFPAAHVRAETLFDGPQEDPSKIERKRQIERTAESEDAMEAYLRNLRASAVRVQDPIRTADFSTPQSKEYLAVLNEYKAKTAFGDKAVKDYQASRYPNAATIPMLQQLSSDPRHGAWVTQ